MYNYMIGKVTDVEASSIIVEVSGIGYQINTPNPYAFNLNEEYKIYLYQYPRCFGFVGTSLTGVIITFILGLYLINFWVMISGLAMGICYFIGEVFDRIVPDNKSGWNWGEWIFGAYLGGVFACALM